MSKPTEHLIDALDDLSLNWLITLDVQTAPDFIRVMDAYNEFTPTRGLRLLEGIDALLPRASYPDVQHKYRIGREYSRVLYVMIYKFDLQRAGIAEGQLADALHALGQEARADELFVQEDDGAWFTYRFWWD